MAATIATALSGPICTAIGNESTRMLTEVDAAYSKQAPTPHSLPSYPQEGRVRGRTACCTHIFSKDYGVGDPRGHSMRTD